LLLVLLLILLLTIAVKREILLELTVENWQDLYRNRWQTSQGISNAKNRSLHISIATEQRAVLKSHREDATVNMSVGPASGAHEPFNVMIADCLKRLTERFHMREGHDAV
jgi:hypothetical protein